MALRTSAVVIAAVLVGACGSPPSAGSARSPLGAIVSPSVPSSPGSVPASSPSPAPAPVAPLLVIWDIAQTQVRLARMDATDVATVQGQYLGIAGGQVIIGNGTTLQALDRTGKVRKLGQLAGTPNQSDKAPVAVKPDLSQWLYTLTDDKWTSRIHLGTPTGDTLIATIPSPDGNLYYQAYAWNASGVYMVKEATGLGGASPFLEYHFDLAKFDLTTNRVTDVSPACSAYGVLDDGTMICRTSYESGQLEVRSASGIKHSIQIALGNDAASANEFWKVFVSPDGKRLVAGRNGAKDPVLNYQMAEADLAASTLASFGPLDYNPDAWLPDGRVVAEHQCVYIDWGAGPCSASLDGTYVFSADGKSRTLFYKLKSGW